MLHQLPGWQVIGGIEKWLERIIQANRYKAPNLNVNYFLCGQGSSQNEAAEENAGGRREGAEVCDTFWGVK